MKESHAGAYSPESLGQMSLAQIQEARKESAKRRKQSRVPALVAQERGGVVPLSHGQERLWFLDQLGLVGSAYNMLFLLKLEGTLNAPALQRSFSELARRHEVLRTRFESTADGPVQVIDPPGDFMLEIRSLPETEPDATQWVQRLSKEEANRPFDLSRGPLLRATLLRLSEHDHVLLMTLHHIVCDGWSLSVLNQELGDLYAAYSRGCSSPLVELPVQYADYSLWQRRWLQGQTLESQLQYWKNRLSGAPPQLELPTDRPRPPVASFKGAELRFTLPTRLHEGLKQLARNESATIFMVALAAFQVLLSRWSGQQDVVVGSPVTGRSQREVEGLIGFFVQTLVLRTEVEADLSFREFLKRVKEVTLGAHANQDLPFEVLVKELRPDRDLTRQPIFQVMLTWQNQPEGSVQLPGLAWTPTWAEEVTSQFDLTLHLFETSEGLVGLFQYASDLFDASTIERMVGHFRTIVEAVVANPESQIRALPWLTDIERRQLLQEWSGGVAAFPDDRLIHELFEAQVRLRPDAIAAVYEKHSLTYADLNARANQLARYLVAKGVRPNELVGLCVEPGLRMVVGLLGILKAGGAYLPLNAAYPPERLAYMLRDASPRVVLIEEQLRARLPTTSAAVIALDSDESEVANQPTGDLDSHASEHGADRLAYVIYTSGSTGDPKGVMVEHRNVTRLFAATDRWFAFNASDVWTLFHSVAFDFSVWELWGALFYGGRVIVVPHLTARSPKDFYQLLCREAVTVLNQTPSAFAQLIDAQAHSSEKHSLRAVIFGGEALELRMLRPWVERNGAEAPRLINMYGITETTVHVTYRALTAEEIMSERGSLIGTPIPDLRIYLLDRHRQPVPIGIAGEMYVGGAGVARGYLNRPELTESRFIEDPFSDDLRARLYKSGDLGRWRVDGTLEYLRRNDDQVKIRGYRIELGEIEVALMEHPAVKQSVVLSREDAPGQKRLVAYIVGAGADDSSEDSGQRLIVELGGYLREKLPEYMIPSAWVVLRTLPLTANGKVDRGALPAPQGRAEAVEGYVEPRTDLERMLARLWVQLLQVDRVGAQDNFFYLGGHSLMIVKLMEQLRQAGLAVSVRSVYENPTLEHLARKLTGEMAKHFEAPPNRIAEGCDAITPDLLPLLDLSAEQIERIVETVPGGARNVQDIYPLSPLQEGLLFHHVLNEKGTDAYVLAMLLALPSQEQLQRFIAALQKVIDRHDVLRTAVLWEQLPQAVQVVYRRAELRVQPLWFDSNLDPVEQFREKLMPELQRMDLRRAPLMCLHVATDARDGQWYAALQFHHLIDDNTSIETMFSEVGAFLQGRERELPEPVPYRNYVVQALAYSRSHEAEAFFRAKLADVSEPTAPFGLLDVYGDGSQIDEARRELDPSLAREVRSEARRSGVSAATLFHAAWALVVARTSNRTDVMFGTVLFGRLQGSAGAQRILGMFINSLPLRLRLESLTARDLVERTQRELMELLDHEHASLAEAQRCSGIGGSGPLFSSLLNYRHSDMDAETEIADGAGLKMLAASTRSSYPIAISVDDFGQGFTTSAFTDRRVDPQRVVDYLHTALRSLVSALAEEPRTQALALPVLPELERRQLIESFNRTRVDYGDDTSIHELFEGQVARTPDAIALVCDGQSLTYAELNRKANQLARYLRKGGVTLGRLVAIAFERSVEMVVSVLGVLKAGAAYVPLDPGLPAERIAYVLGDANPSVLLTQGRFARTLPETVATVVAVDEQWDEIANEEAGNLERSRSSAQCLAYVMYTSGSTGRPKGVMVCHGNIVNYARHVVRQFDVAAGEGSFIGTSMNFDLSLTGFYPPLICGRSVTLCTAQEDLPQLLLQGRNLAPVKLTPTHLSMLSLPDERVDGCIRTLVLGGEPLKASALRWWREHSPQTRIFNHYGPTETTVGCIVHEVANDAEGAIPIGRPISNTQVYILSSDLAPTPIGAVGEIYIGGAGVSRGYLNHPSLTAQRFICDPFSTDGSARLYKTGDLGKWRADGTVEYLGRNDHQVKIRGFRIELEEIEAQLERAWQVKEAVVIAREDTPGDERLVAYVTLHDPADSPDVAQTLRANLQVLLPEYMVPSAFVVLHGLPLTPNGKLDRRALPPPESGMSSTQEYEAPRGEIEQAVARVWEDLLHVERVGRQDNFFEIGGHSLLATRAVARLRRLLHVELSLKALFDAPTLAKLSLRIEEERQAQSLQEQRRTQDLASNLREEIGEMDDDAVAARIVELERESGYAQSGG